MDTVIIRETPVREVFKDQDVPDWLDGKIEWARRQLRLRKHVPLTVFLLCDEGDGTSRELEIVGCRDTEFVRSIVENIAAQKDVYVYCAVFEGWMLSDPADVEEVESSKHRYPIAAHANRKETVMSIIESKSVFKHAYTEVIRKPNGDPFLGKTHELPAHGVAEGVLTGILYNVPAAKYKFESLSDSEFCGEGMCARMSDVENVVRLSVGALEKKLGRPHPSDIRIEAWPNANP